MIADTGTDARSSRLRLDSSLSGLKRENVACHASRRSRAANTASPGTPPGPAPSTTTVVFPPKHVKVLEASVTQIARPEASQRARRGARLRDTGAASDPHQARSTANSSSRSASVLIRLAPSPVA
jgi:hypothetical protein